MKKEAVALLRKWQKRMLLNEWFFEVFYPDQPYEENEQGGITHATVNADPVYLKANVRLYPSWFSAPNDIREQIIVHELAHCMTQELRDLADKLRDGRLVTSLEINEVHERLTQRISFVAIRDHWQKRRKA